MNDAERERDFYKALAEAYRKEAEHWLNRRHDEESEDWDEAYEKTRRKLDAIRARVEADHAAKPAVCQRCKKRPVGTSLGLCAWCDGTQGGGE